MEVGVTNEQLAMMAITGCSKSADDAVLELKGRIMSAIMDARMEERSKIVAWTANEWHLVDPRWGNAIKAGEHHKS